MKKVLSCVLVLLFLGCLIPVNVFAVSITEVAATDISRPIVGQKPDVRATSAASNYNVDSVSWTEYDADWEWQRDMGANDTFRENCNYVVFVKFSATGSDSFVQSTVGRINGKEANKYNPTDNGKSITIYTSYESKKGISNVALSVVMPVVGKTPTFARVDAAGYLSENYGGYSNMANGVFWKNQSSGIHLSINNPFKEGTKYTLGYMIVAKEGYVFTETAEFTVNGKHASAQIVDSSDGKERMLVTVSDIVPGDGKKEISSVDVSVVAPKEQEKPDFSKIDSTGYVSDNGSAGSSTKVFKNGIAWYKSSTSHFTAGTNETFTGGVEYTVKISLVPKDGYKFSSAVTARINGKTATVETFDDGSICVSVRLTAAKKEHKHTDSAWKSDDANHWKVCTDCGTVTVAKAAHADKNSDGKCDTCALALPKEDVQDTPETDAPTDTPTDTTPEPDVPTEPEDGEDVGAPEENATPEIPEDDKKNPVLPESENEESKRVFGWLGILLVSVIGLLVLGGAAAVIVVIAVKKKAKNKAE